jgi:hypothetical protein
VGRFVGVRGNRAVQSREQLRCLLFGAHALSGHIDLVRIRKANRIVSFDWEKYDQGHVVYRPAQMSGDEFRLGHAQAFRNFYSLPSIASRVPIRGGRRRAQWLIYNMFMRRGSQVDRAEIDRGANRGP